MTFLRVGGAILLALVLTSGTVAASGGPFQPPDLKGVGIDQRLGIPVPLGTVFRDEDGQAVELGKYFDSKPVLLAPAYFTCPMLCSQVLSGVVSALRPLSLKPGRDFEIVAISFDPHDTAAVAKDKRDHYARSYSARGGTSGWHFLTGSQASINAVMDAIGFHYHWDAVNKMFIHASGVMILTPDGRVSRYLYGVDYEPKDLKLSLIESANRTIGSPADQILLLCYHYDPRTGKYGAAVINLLRGAAALMLAIMVIAFTVLFRREVQLSRRHAQGVSET